MDTKSITALIVSVAIAVAFLFVVIAPVFQVEIPAQTQTLVFGLFAALAGFGGSQYGEQQAVKRLNTLKS